ncbi:hypothetical protein [Halomarina halobia]|uniref:DUF4239 domain-containing protein n=1 Tax=Halomarina halobia TaxID=3033386 RepID=A0ABD6A5L5_9EURY
MWWFLFDGNRSAVAGLMLVGVIAIVLAFGFVGLIDVTKTNRMMWLFNGIVNGILTLVTVVIALNQLVLSRELDSVSNFYDRLDETVAFRQSVEERAATDVASPVPTDFLGVLLRTLRDRALTLREDELVRRDEDVRRDVERYVPSLIEQTDRTIDTLEETRTEFEALSAVVRYRDSWYFYFTRRVRVVHGDALSDTASAATEEMLELLKEIDAARQYFKTLYVQRSLARLSRRLVYTGSLSILIAVLTVLVYRNTPNAALDPVPLLLVTSVVIAVALSPIAVLFASGLRVATVARETASFGPFVPQQD